MVVTDTTLRIAYIANVRFPSERAHAAQIAHMCQAFANIDLVDMDLIVNKRTQVTKSETEVWFGQAIEFAIHRIAPRWFFSKPRIFFYLSEVVFSMNVFLLSRKKHYDVIYGRNEWVVYILSLLLPHKQLVWESHEAKLNFPARNILQKGIKTVVISDGIYEEYIAYGIKDDQLHIAYDAIDDLFFEPVESQGAAQKRLQIDSQKKIVMYIGGFASWKGIHVFAQAARYANDCQFVAIGGTQKEIADMTRLYREVAFLPQTEYRDLRHVQQAADILVVPNTNESDISSRYTSPLKLFAHMASGIPLVISDVPSLTSVTGRESVTLFVPNDSKSLAQAVDHILQTYGASRQQAIDVRQTAMQYTWNHRARGIINFLSG